MPAPTVSFVASSTTMNAPVARTLLVRVGHERGAEPQADAADRVELELVGGLVRERRDVEPVLDRLEPRGDRARRVLDHVAGARAGGRVAEPAHASPPARAPARAPRPGGRAGRRGRRRARPRAPRAIERGAAAVSPPSSNAAIRERVPDGQHDDVVADPQRAGGEPAGVPAAAVGADHVLHRQARGAVGERRCRPARPRGARAATRRAYHGIAAERSTTLSPCSARHRDEADAVQAEPRGTSRSPRARPRRSAPRRSRRGPSCSRARSRPARRAAPRSPGGGATARSSRGGRRRARARGRRSTRPSPCCACTARGRGSRAARSGGAASRSGGTRRRS